jgi:RHS repeat-associated protein
MKLPNNIIFSVFRTRNLVLSSWFLGVVLFSPSVTYAAASRTVTYIGNYEVTVEDGVGKKETVRVAGTMGKVVKSRTADGRSRNIPTWKYSYITTDAQGSTRQELTQSQINNPELVEGPNTYYAYGTPIPSSHPELGSGSILNAQKQIVEDTYTGQKKDEETGLMYYNARYYNPQTGLFVQADSVDDTANKYQYVASNPINNTDPSGNWCWFGRVGNSCEEDAIKKQINTSEGVELSSQAIDAVVNGFLFYPKELRNEKEVMIVTAHLRQSPKFNSQDPSIVSMEKRRAGFVDHTFNPNIIRLTRTGDWITEGGTDIYAQLRETWNGPLSFEEASPDKQLSTVVHEFAHTLSYEGVGSYSSLFKQYYGILLDSGVTIDSSGKVEIPGNLQNLIPKGSYATESINELFAELSVVYTGIDEENSYGSNKEFADLWDDMYKFYREQIFDGQEFIEVQE